MEGTPLAFGRDIHGVELCALFRKGGSSGQGHKDEVLATQRLIQASEFVRLKTRRYNDEHLAGVFQIITKRPISDDFSGAAIRKKRLYLKKHYPVLYANALRRANSTVDPPSAPSFHRGQGNVILLESIGALAGIL